MVNEQKIINKIQELRKCSDNEVIKQGELSKELKESMTRLNSYQDDIVLYGRMYFSDEKLKKLQEDARKYLKIDDLDIAQLKKDLDSDRNTSVGAIEGLMDKEEKITELKVAFENNTNNVCDSFDYNKLFNMNGGDSNER